MSEREAEEEGKSRDYLHGAECVFMFVCLSIGRLGEGAPGGEEEEEEVEEEEGSLPG